MVSIEDVAQRAGVSVATVSRALRGLPNVADTTRRRVEAAARDLDYVSDPSAARLAAGRTRTLGLVLPGLGTWYQSRIMAAVHDVWHSARHDLLAIVVDDHSERERFLRDLPFRKRVDGLLVVDVPFTEEEFERLLDTGVGVVTTGARSAQVPSVGIDDRGAARMLVEHVTQLGHRRIAVLGASTTQPFHFVGVSHRMAGVVDALEDAGVELPDAWSLVTDWTADDAAEATRRVLDGGPPPTAFVCFSDEIAFGALGVLRQHGLRVPRDVSVVGFDDHDLAVHLDLTTVHQPVASVGRRAAGLLLQRLDAPDERVTHEVLPSRVVLRGSTAIPADTEDRDAGDRSTGRSDGMMTTAAGSDTAISSTTDPDDAPGVTDDQLGHTPATTP